MLIILCTKEYDWKKNLRIVLHVFVNHMSEEDTKANRNIIETRRYLHYIKR